MTAQNSLTKYTNAVEALEEHKEANKAIFDAHQKLVYAVMDAENELRDDVAESNEPISNHKFRVTLTPQTQRVYDEDKLKQMLSGPAFAEVVNDVKRPTRITISAIK